MKRTQTSIFTILLFCLVFTLQARGSEAPTIPIEKVLEIATQYIDSKSIDVSNHYVGSAEYHIRFGLMSFWQVEWRLMKLTKGGQIYVFVYADGKTEHRFSE